MLLFSINIYTVLRPILLRATIEEEAGQLPIVLARPPLPLEGAQDGCERAMCRLLYGLCCECDDKHIYHLYIYILVISGNSCLNNCHSTVFRRGFHACCQNFVFPAAPR
jgi:hypothetical protein